MGGDSEESLLGLNTDRSLRDVLTLVRENERPELLVSSGDISNDYTQSSYERFMTIVNEHFPETPLAWLPGNHDDPEKMASAIKAHPRVEPIEQHYLVGGWSLIFLNSRVPREEGGDLNAWELKRLKALLEAHPHPTMIFLHHQPLPVGSAWVDQYVVKSADTFLHMIDQYAHVKAVSWGHVHQEYFTRRNTIDYFATPSTCVQFVPQNDEFKVDYAMPGYRKIDLYPDGTFSTKVFRVEGKDYVIDYASTGY